MDCRGQLCSWSGLKWVRERFDTEGITRFRSSSGGWSARVSGHETVDLLRQPPAREVVDFKALLVDLRAQRRAGREVEQKAVREDARDIPLLPKLGSGSISGAPAAVRSGVREGAGEP